MLNGPVIDYLNVPVFLRRDYNEEIMMGALDARITIPGTTVEIPNTGWTAPKEFPRLEAAKILSIDTETYDPNLKTKGPGWATGDGHLVGVSVGTDDGHSWYFPMRHEVGGGNMDPDAVLRWAKAELTRPSQPKIGANLQYDVGWLRHEGVRVQGELRDIQFAEPLLDEHRFTYALDALAKDYLNEGKVDDALYNWCWRAYGGKEGRWQARNIHRAPACLVGPYAESDADLPMRIYALQEKKLESEGLLDLFRMECSLIYMLVDMRMRGVRVDVEGAHRVNEAMKLKEAEITKQLGGIDVNSKPDLQRAFNKEGVAYPKTKKGNPSFTKAFLEGCSHPLAQMIIQKRKLAKSRGTFVEGYIIDKAVNGRVHAEFHPLRSDENGTVSGRFSSSGPNLQNIPARDEEMKKLIRGLFLPEEGEQWVSIDYSQIEYRLMVHAASGPGSEDARQQYIDHPETDYHKMTQLMVKQLLNREVDRKPIKNINFGKIFGMGKAALKQLLVGLTDAEADAFFDAYDEAVPYAKTTAERASAKAASRGHIFTILKRRARFPQWEPSKYYTDSDKKKILEKDNTFFDLQNSREEAVEKWGGRVKRARTHKAMNCYTQGSCADIIKKAMVDMHSAGLLTPLLQVHDELDWSMPLGAAGDEIIVEIKDVMEHAVKLKIPVLADVETGPNWGALTK